MFDDNLERFGRGLDILDKNWFGNLVVELGSFEAYFSSTGVGFDILGQDVGNVSRHLHSLGQHFGNEEMRFGILVA